MAVRWTQRDFSGKLDEFEQPKPTPEERLEILEKRVADLERLSEGLLKEHQRWRQWMKAWPR